MQPMHVLRPLLLADADEGQVVAEELDILLRIRLLPDEVGVYAELHCGSDVRLKHLIDC